MGEERLTQDELALVLRRAAELDVTPLPDERLPVAAVEAAAAEVGLPATAVRQAVAELRAGLLLPEDVPAPTPAMVVEAVVAPHDADRAMAEVARWLEAQTFHRHRGRDGVEVWRPREDWVAGLQRRFDWSAAVRLKGVREVVVRAAAVQDGTLLRLEATLDGFAVHAPMVGAGAGATLVGVLGTAWAATVGAPPAFVVDAVATGGGGYGGWRLGRSILRRRRYRVSDELAAALDRLAAGKAVDQSALQRLRARVGRDRHRGRWA